MTLPFSTRVDTIELPYAVQLGEDVFLNLVIPCGERSLCSQVQTAHEMQGGVSRGVQSTAESRCGRQVQAGYVEGSCPQTPGMEDEMPRESIRQWKRRVQSPSQYPSPSQSRNPSALGHHLVVPQGVYDMFEAFLYAFEYESSIGCAACGSINEESTVNGG